MASIGDIIQGTFKHTLLGQQVINVGYWEVLVPSAGDLVLFTLGDELVGDYETSVMTELAQDMVFNSLELLNLSDGLEFADIPSGQAGVKIGSPLPAFNAMTIKLNRSTRLTRNGSKRIAGLLESNTENGVIIMTSAERQNIADFWSEQKNYSDYDGLGNDVFLAPRIVGRTKNIDGNYELDLSKVNGITGNSVSLNVSSQVSRKP